MEPARISATLYLCLLPRKVVFKVKGLYHIECAPCAFADNTEEEADIGSPWQPELLHVYGVQCCFLYAATVPQ